ncbi:MAG: hypothetical protein AAF581_17415 [Planctomycetota bacterium]
MRNVHRLGATVSLFLIVCGCRAHVTFVVPSAAPNKLFLIHDVAGGLPTPTDDRYEFDDNGVIRLQEERAVKLERTWITVLREDDELYLQRVAYERPPSIVAYLVGATPQELWDLWGEYDGDHRSLVEQVREAESLVP